MPIKWADDEQPKSRIRWDDQPQIPMNATVLGAPQETREDQLRRQAQEDIVAGMSTFDKMSAGWSHGITRMGQAIKQGLLHAPGDNLLVRGAKAVLPESGAANIDNALRLLGVDKLNQAAQDYDRKLSDEEVQYQMALGKDPNAYVSDFAGTMAATLPLGGPSTKGGTILANMAKNAIPAALVSATTTPVEAGDDFLAAKARQAAVGGTVAGAVSGALQGAGRLIEEIPMGNILRRGYNWLAEKANSTPKAAEGEALAQKLGVELTPGQVSGGKGQLAAENLARQSIFTRDQVFENDMKIADQYATAIGKQLDKLSSRSADPASVGRSIKDEVNGAIERLSARRAKLAQADFAKVDELARGAPVIDPTNYKSAVQQIIDENSVAPKGSDAHALAEAAKELLSSAADNGKAGNALKTRRYLSQIAGGQASFAGSSGQPVQKRAAAQLLSALDSDIESATGKGGSLGEALKEANARYTAYSQRINAIKEGPIGSILGKDLVDKSGYGFGDVAPEKIYERFTQLHPTQVELAMTHMSPEAANQVKRAYVQKALESAQMETAAGGAAQTNVRPLTFVRALQRDGNTVDRAKLRAIFQPDELKEIDDLMNVGRRIGDRTGANTSETAVMGQTMGLLEKLRSLSLKGATEVAGSALGTREIARIMSDSGGRRALMELRKLPEGSARARQLTAYIAGLAAGKESDEFRQNVTKNDKR